MLKQKSDTWLCGRGEGREEKEKVKGSCLNANADPNMALSDQNP